MGLKGGCKGLMGLPPLSVSAGAPGPGLSAPTWPLPPRPRQTVSQWAVCLSVLADVAFLGRDWAGTWVQDSARGHGKPVQLSREGVQAACLPGLVRPYPSGKVLGSPGSGAPELQRQQGPSLEYGGLGLDMSAGPQPVTQGSAAALPGQGGEGFVPGFTANL